MKPTIVDHYGVHRASNGLLYIIQDDEQNSRGLNVKSNIKVKTHRRLPVTHDLRLEDGTLSDSDARAIAALEKNKLGRLFLPIPTNAGKIVFIEDFDVNHYDLMAATMLSNPIPRVPVVAAWRLTTGELAGQARRTNIQPFVITGVTPRWMKEYGSQIVDLYRMGTRPLVLVGSSDVVLPPEIERVRGTAIRKVANLSDHPANVGGIYLRNWMRKQ